jgi:hypothetical protein
LFRDRRPTVSINKIDRVDVNVPFHPILADIIAERLVEHYRRTTPQFTASPITAISEEQKFETRWLKIVEAAGKILSVLSGIAIIVFIIAPHRWKSSNRKSSSHKFASHCELYLDRWLTLNRGS